MHVNNRNSDEDFEIVEIEPTVQSRGGRKPLDDVDRRRHRVVVKMNDEERAILDRDRGLQEAAVFIRALLRGSQVTVVPPVNRIVCEQLGKLRDLVSQVAGSNAMDSEVHRLLADVRDEIRALQFQVQTGSELASRRKNA